MVFKRKIFEDLVNSQKSKKISLIFGPRQVGKTHLMKRLAKQTKNYKYFKSHQPITALQNPCNLKFQFHLLSIY
jgi:predicted AAA+ superfamily ATPase